MFGLVTYMLMSEYSRERKAEYKYLTMAFAGLGLHRLITAGIFLFIVFGRLDIRALQAFAPILLHFLEIFAFILLANAFIYPYREQSKKILSTIEFETTVACIITIVIQVLWLGQLAKNPFDFFGNFYGFAVLNTLKILFLLYPIFIIIKHALYFRYRHSILAAFAIITVVPLSHVVSFFIYGYLHPAIDVFVNPFPLVSVLLFTKVIYLKLVDKATLKDELRQSREKYKEAKELSELKDRFVSVVSHELRTPLTSMKLYSKLLLQGKMGTLGKRQKKAVGIISSETDRLSNLINDILHLSKLESKKADIKPELFDFYAFAHDNHLYELAREKGIKVKVQMPKKFTIFAEPEKFKLVFINLVGNAIKFTSAGGTIRITAAHEAHHDRIFVHDTGIGIPREHIPRLFDKFFQVENYMTRNQGGTGLGLAIAKKIVDMHGGDISVESEVGKGSTFTVIIPRKQ